MSLATRVVDKPVYSGEDKTRLIDHHMHILNADKRVNFNITPSEEILANAVVRTFIVELSPDQYYAGERCSREGIVPTIEVRW